MPFLQDLPVLQTVSNIGNIQHLSNSDPESNTPSKVNFNYFDIHKFHYSPENNSCSNKAFSLLNCNIRSIQANFDNLVQFLNDLNYPFNTISLSETWLKDVRANCFCASLLRTRITCHVMPRHASSARAKY